MVIFDLDDTLVDHSSAMQGAALALHRSAGLSVAPWAFVESWREAHRRYAPRYSAGELTYETATRGRMRETVGPDLSDERADMLFRDYLEVYETGCVLFPDVLPCFDRLGSTRLGIISNGRSSEQRRKLTATAIGDRLEYVLISDDCGCAKPNPDIFRRACDAVGVPTGSAVYVGDDYDIDARAARTAGLKGIWLDRGGAASESHHGPVIKSLDELIDLLSVAGS